MSDKGVQCGSCTTTQTT